MQGISSSKWISVIASVLLVAHEAPGQKISVEKGHVYLEAKEGQRVLVATEPWLKEAAVSSDGKRLAILRGADPTGLELMILTASGTGAKLDWIIPSPVICQQYKLPFEGTLQWSPDGRRVYVMAEFSSTSAFLLAFMPETREMRCLGPVVSYSVILSSSAPYSGHVVALLRKHKVLHPYYWYWLLEPDGKELHPIGDEDELNEFLDLYGVRLSAPFVGRSAKK